MGVKGLLEAMSGIFKNIKMVPEQYHFHERKYDHVFIEMNFFLHKYLGPKELNPSIYEDINFWHGLIQPKESFNLVFDGSPPLIKLGKMRKSRHRLISRNFEYKCKITAGTDFMNDFEQNLNSKLKMKHKIFSHLEIGEGEMKIVKEIKEKNLKNSLVISPDNDMLILSVSMGNMDLLLNHRDRNRVELINLGSVEETLLFLSPNDPIQARLDLTLLLLLLGNDYYVRFPAFNFPQTWENYQRNKQKYPNQYLIRKLDDKWIINIPFLMECMDKQIEPSSERMTFNSERDLYVKYLQTILWNFEMYQEGSCLDYSFLPKLPNDIAFNVKKLQNHYNYFTDQFIESIQPPRTTKSPINTKFLQHFVIPDPESSYLESENDLTNPEVLYSLEKKFINSHPIKKF